MKDVERLIEILEEERGLLEEFLDLLREEKDHLLKRDEDGLHRVATRMEGLLYRIRKVDELVGEGVKRVSPGALTLEDLIKEVEGPFRRRLVECRSKLRALEGAVKELIGENSIIINRNLEVIGGTLLFLRESLSQETYSPSGRME